MKRLMLSASLILFGVSAFAPVALAKQASTPQALSEDATIHDLVLYNRDARSQK